MQRLFLQVRGYRPPGMIPDIMYLFIKYNFAQQHFVQKAAQGRFDVVVGALTYVHSRDVSVTVLTVSMSSRAPLRDDRQNA